MRQKIAAKAIVLKNHDQDNIKGLQLRNMRTDAENKEVIDFFIA